MSYSLHPEAESDLRDAAEFYRERAGKTEALRRNLLIRLPRQILGELREGKISKPLRRSKPIKLVLLGCRLSSMAL